MEKKRKVKAQSPTSPITFSTKKTLVKGLGFVIFVIGAFIILNSYLGTPIVGDVVIGPKFSSTASIAGILLEIIGITLMVIKLDNKECKEVVEEKKLLVLQRKNP